MVSPTNTVAVDSNANDMEDGAPAYGLATVKLVELSLATVMAVEDAMAAAAMLVALARVTAAVLSVTSAAWAAAGVVKPVAMVMVHVEPFASVAVAAVSVRAALLSPELATVLVNVVVPHPEEYVGVASEAMV